nr:DUF5682 family protein [Paenibacillus sambharensis]
MNAAARAADLHRFGVRHLSPAGASHLRRVLDQVQPQLILVEGPSDASELISQITLPKVVPPIAIMAYTDSLPVRTIVFPLAAYSPEYQAFQWAREHGVEAQFFDLPSGAAIGLNEARRSQCREQEEGEGEGERPSAAFRRRQNAIYDEIARLSGETDYESYWERSYEHTTRPGDYSHAIHTLSAELRALMEADERVHDPAEAAYNELREAYMRRNIRDALDRGIPAGKIVAVTGAHHTSAMDLSLPCMEDEELALLPAASTKLTLMPYSYYKLSSLSGYGAGNLAPAYFELFWQCLQKGELEALPARYLSQVVTYMREGGTYRSTASVIEGVRLAESLALLRGSRQPVWRDLRDAAIVTLGFGELSAVAEPLARADVGTAIGYLPEGVSQTPIQDDMTRNLKLLKLEKYKTTVAAELELDLRENRRVKTEDAAFLDLRRSVFLSRLQVLGISFARRQKDAREAVWAERWILQWTPEAEIEVVESTLLGETVEVAAAYRIREQLEVCSDIREAARIIRTAWECGLPGAMEDARRTLQQMAVDNSSVPQIAGAARELSLLVSFGNIRKLDTAMLEPIVQQLFLRGTLLLVEASACSDEAAAEMIAAIQDLHAISQDHYERIDDDRWVRQLRELAFRDDRNARLSGYAFALLLERNMIEPDRLSQEVSRRLSPGIPADLGAGWFEGLSMRNRYALLSRSELWRLLDEYIQSLDDEQFRRSVVFLRRAFGSFQPSEKSLIAETLGEIWGIGGLEAGDLLQQELSEEEKGKLDELNEFDFGDL